MTSSIYSSPQASPSAAGSSKRPSVSTIPENDEGIQQENKKDESVLQQQQQQQQQQEQQKQQLQHPNKKHPNDELDDHSRHVRWGDDHVQVHSIPRRRTSLLGNLFYSARDILRFKNDKFEEDAQLAKEEKLQAKLAKKQEKQAKKQERKAKIAARRAKRKNGTAATTEGADAEETGVEMELELDDSRKMNLPLLDNSSSIQEDGLVVVLDESSSSAVSSQGEMNDESNLSHASVSLLGKSQQEQQSAETTTTVITIHKAMEVNKFENLQKAPTTTHLPETNERSKTIRVSDDNKTAKQTEREARKRDRKARMAARRAKRNKNLGDLLDNDSHRKQQEIWEDDSISSSIMSSIDQSELEESVVSLSDKVLEEGTREKPAEESAHDSIGHWDPQPQDFLNAAPPQEEPNFQYQVKRRALPPPSEKTSCSEVDSPALLPENDNDTSSNDAIPPLVPIEHAAIQIPDNPNQLPACSNDDLAEEPEIQNMPDNPLAELVEPEATAAHSNEQQEPSTTQKMEPVSSIIAPTSPTRAMGESIKASANPEHLTPKSESHSDLKENSGNGNNVPPSSPASDNSNKPPSSPASPTLPPTSMIPPPPPPPTTASSIALNTSPPTTYLHPPPSAEAMAMPYSATITPTVNSATIAPTVMPQSNAPPVSDESLLLPKMEPITADCTDEQQSPRSLFPAQPSDASGDELSSSKHSISSWMFNSWRHSTADAQEKRRQRKEARKEHKKSKKRHKRHRPRGQKPNDANEEIDHDHSSNHAADDSHPVQGEANESSSGRMVKTNSIRRVIMRKISTSIGSKATTKTKTKRKQQKHHHHHHHDNHHDDHHGEHSHHKDQPKSQKDTYDWSHHSSEHDNDQHRQNGGESRNQGKHYDWAHHPQHKHHHRHHKDETKEEERPESRRQNQHKHKSKPKKTLGLSDFLAKDGATKKCDNEEENEGMSIADSLADATNSVLSELERPRRTSSLIRVMKGYTQTLKQVTERDRHQRHQKHGRPNHGGEAETEHANITSTSSAYDWEHHHDQHKHRGDKKTTGTNTTRSPKRGKKQRVHGAESLMERLVGKTASRKRTNKNGDSSDDEDSQCSDNDAAHIPASKLGFTGALGELIEMESNSSKGQRKQ